MGIFNEAAPIIAFVYTPKQKREVIMKKLIGSTKTRKISGCHQCFHRIADYGIPCCTKTFVNEVPMYKVIDIPHEELIINTDTVSHIYSEAGHLYTALYICFSNEKFEVDGQTYDAVKKQLIAT